MEIAINKMYAGNYLDGDNIGHEIINLYKSDNGKNYIYLNKDGFLPKIHNSKIVAVLLVRQIKLGVYEVIAKAENLQQRDFAEYSKETARELQIQFIRDNNIKYDGVWLNEIFEKNKYKDKIDEHSLFLTFEAERVIKVKHPVYITEYQDNDKEAFMYSLDMRGGHFANQSLRRYINESETPEAYAKLLDIMSNKALWEESNTTKTVSESGKAEDIESDFISILGKEHDEVAYSSMITHFLEADRNRTVDFCEQVLKVVINNRFSVKAEYCGEKKSCPDERKRIDILIFDDCNVIVLENKIKAGIHGIRHDADSEELLSQLNDYEKMAKKLAGNKKKISLFVLCPNYSKIQSSSLVEGSGYSVITYSNLLDFFNQDRYSEDCDEYYREFLKALKRHTREVDNTNFETMQERFLNTITLVKAKL